MPSMPLTGSELISSDITELVHASCNTRARSCALTRVSRDKPEPLSITEPCAMLPKRSASHSANTSRAASGVPWPRCNSASVRNSCCAITLLLYLLMSRTTSPSVGDWTSKVGGVAGATPSCTLPRSSPPISDHRPASMRSLKLFGSACATGQCCSPQTPG